jgi:hypothetical protein
MTTVARLVISAALCVALAANAAAQEGKLPKLHTNQAYVEEVTRASTLAIDDPMAVFAFVLGTLPERVKVYPTENFYYFSFVHNGRVFAGNIRLDARTRDEDKVNFTYFEQASAWHEDTPDISQLLGAGDGVTVEKADRFLYRVSYGGKSVAFELNDLTQVKPPAALLGPDERFIGPIFDESAVRFFLVYNAKLRLFHYLLDETAAVTDALAATGPSGRILIDRRTGFAYYRDDRRKRKILIGVFEGNVRVNNFFDGPFDQMPDNFHQGDTFRQALYAVDPDVRGELDRFGAFADGARYAIVPYMHYRRLKDLDVFHRCATSKRIPAAAYYACFVLAPGPERGAKARPLAMERRTR